MLTMPRTRRARCRETWTNHVRWPTGVATGAGFTREERDLAGMTAARFTSTDKRWSRAARGYRSIAKGNAVVNI